MTSHQAGIFAVGTRSHHHLFLDLDPGADARAALDVVRRLRDRATTVAGVNTVVALGSRVAATALPGQVPADLAPFADIVGPDGTTIPAEQHDLWVWLHSFGPDAVFDQARAIGRELTGLATVVDEQPSFTYLASQDLTGFED